MIYIQLVKWQVESVWVAQLTFRSLSLSRNISLSTSLVSAVRTVCMVAVEQSVCRRERRERMSDHIQSRDLVLKYMKKKTTDGDHFWFISLC